MAHVAIFLPSVDGGGAERVSIHLAEGLASRGHHVDLVLVNSDGPYLSEISRKVNIIDLKQKRVVLSLPKLCRYLRQNRPTALISGLSHANIIAILAKMLGPRQVKIFVTEHNNLNLERLSKKEKLIRCLMALLYRNANGIITVSEGIRKQILSLLPVSPQNVHTIYNPVNLDRIRRLAAQVPENSWFSPPSIPIVISVGRLTPQKDFNTLITAFHLLRRRMHAKMVILGEGEDRISLEKLILDLNLQDDVLMPGFQANPYSWMAHSDLYVMSSAWEGLPGVLLEALVCDLPVVSTDCETGPNEILENGKWGLLVPVNQPKKLADAMYQALTSSIKLRTSCRAEDFHIDRIVNQYENLILG